MSSSWSWFVTCSEDWRPDHAPLRRVVVDKRERRVLGRREGRARRSMMDGILRWAVKCRALMSNCNRKQLIVKVLRSGCGAQGAWRLMRSLHHKS